MPRPAGSRNRRRGRRRQLNVPEGQVRTSYFLKLSKFLAKIEY